MVANPTLLLHLPTQAPSPGKQHTALLDTLLSWTRCLQSLLPPPVPITITTLTLLSNVAHTSSATFFSEAQFFLELALVLNSSCIVSKKSSLAKNNH